jgi:hypothetical protein
MGTKVQIDGKEYNSDQLSENGLFLLQLYGFTVEREKEAIDNLALLERAKNSYIRSLKNEMISSKAGFLFDDK